MGRKISFAPDSREALVKGVDLLSKAVTTTLGPKGRNVGLGRKWNAPKVVHDGVSVAKEIEHADPFVDMGIQLARDSASKTNDVAGDGTTTSILLTQALVSEGNRRVQEGVNPMMIQRGLNKAVERVLKELKKRSVPVNDNETISQIGSLSAASEEIGEMIATAIERVGKKGVITAEIGYKPQTHVEYKEGMEFDRGYISKAFITNDHRSICEIENPYVVLVADRITSNHQIMPILNAIGAVEQRQHFGLLLIADKVDYEALGTLIINREKGVMSPVAIESPGFGEKRKELLEDIAVLTGAKVIYPSQGFNFETEINIDMFGKADKLISGADSTKLIGGNGDKDALAIRVAQIEKKIEEEKSEFEREKLEERVARLAGSAAIINVGAATDTELHDKKERVIDAVNATKAAIEEGILPGGGVSLLRAREVLVNFGKNLNDEERVGAEILYAALKRPIVKLFENAAVSKETLQKVEHAKGDMGYDVIDNKFGSLLEMGIIDPTKVVRAGLRNAVSVAGTILTTDVLVAPKDESIGKSN